jgi:hypothetical protein
MPTTNGFAGGEPSDEAAVWEYGAADGGFATTSRMFQPYTCELRDKDESRRLVESLLNEKAALSPAQIGGRPLHWSAWLASSSLLHS